MMTKSNLLSRLFTQSYFRTLPDGKRVICFDSKYFLIPEETLETLLCQKIYWTNLILFVLATIVLILTITFPGIPFRSSIFIFFWIGFREIIVRAILRKDTRNLQNLDITTETTFFYENFMNKVRAGSNNGLPSYEISTYLDVPNSQNDKIIMLKYQEAFPNILRCHSDGSIIWQAELPNNSKDVYTNIEWRDQKLVGFSRSCLSVVLDENTGKIISAK